jgi:hypothetical protein
MSGAVVSIMSGNNVAKMAIWVPVKPISWKWTYKNGMYEPTTPQYPK